ncbi:hypothetical protein BGZ95_007547, partial [Linnemannia exigua]
MRVVASSSTTILASSISTSTSASITSAITTSNSPKLESTERELGPMRNKAAPQPNADSPRILSSGALSAFEKQ